MTQLTHATVPRRKGRRNALAVASLLSALACVSAASLVHAHVPSDATSRVSLRDEHVEVIGEWDLFLLASKTPTEVATATEADLSALHHDLVARIEKETVLTVDGTRRTLVVRGFPTPAELRALAATLSASNHEHGALARIRLEAPDTVRDASTIALASPAALGHVNASFVQPVNRYVGEGEAAAFNILAQRPSAGTTRSGATSRNADGTTSHGQPPTGANPPSGVTFAAGLALGLAATILYRTRSSSPT